MQVLPFKKPTRGRLDQADKFSFFSVLLWQAPGVFLVVPHETKQLALLMRTWG